MKICESILTGGAFHSNHTCSKPGFLIFSTADICVCLCVQSCLTFVTTWTVACQSPASMEFPKQEYWSGLPTRLLCLWNFPGKNTGVGSHLLLQKIFLTQGLNQHLLHWQANSSPPCLLGSSSWIILCWGGGGQLNIL